jgi:hypothetical protein
MTSCGILQSNTVPILPTLHFTKPAPIKHMKCANKDCTNKWDTILFEESPVYICGGGAEVCDSCKNNGFRVFNSQGDGLFYLYNNDEEVDVYSYEVAYKITRTINDVHKYIYEDLADGNPPGLDMFSKDLLNDYVKNEIAWECITYDDCNWSDNGWHEKINAGMEELGSNNRLVPLKNEDNVSSKVLFYNFYSGDNCIGVLYFNFSVDSLDIDIMPQLEERK